MAKGTILVVDDEKEIRDLTPNRQKNPLASVYIEVGNDTIIQFNVEGEFHDQTT